MQKQSIKTQTHISYHILLVARFHSPHPHQPNWGPVAIADFVEAFEVLASTSKHSSTSDRWNPTVFARLNARSLDAVLPRQEFHALVQVHVDESVHGQSGVQPIKRQVNFCECQS